MDVPQTVRAALEDRAIEGRRCLEAGAGVGNTTAGLIGAGASDVFSVTNDREHLETVIERLRNVARGDDVTTLECDLRALPLPDDSVDVVTAHALFNVVPTTDLSMIVEELTRVARPGAELIVDDYAPLPEEAKIQELFALENAASELADNRPALTFYPETTLRSAFESRGWSVERRKPLLDPVPWTEAHVQAHAEATRDVARSIEDPLGEAVARKATKLATAIGAESVGAMYSLAFRLREQ